MDDITDIYEISQYGSNCFWVTKEEYDKVRADYKSGEVYIEFLTLEGAEVLIPRDAIADINHFTVEQRLAAKEYQKQYRKQMEAEKEWEE